LIPISYSKDKESFNNLRPYVLFLIQIGHNFVSILLLDKI